MAVIEYSLFRVKFIKPSQQRLFDETAKLTPLELFLQVIDERPSAEIREGYVWHIGNIERFSKTSGYFAAGRTTNATVAKFDETTGDFLEEAIETSPYTHCVYEARIGLLGIAKKTVLAPTPLGIASKIQFLFSTANVIQGTGITVEVLPVANPEDFVAAISSAWQVMKFTAHFRGPNPLDADEFFQKPLSVYLNLANGQQGKAEIKGTDLNREIITEVTRSTAATGNKASARIKRTKKAKAQTISLKDDGVKRRYDEVEHDAKQVIAELMEAYHQVRADDQTRPH